MEGKSSNSVNYPMQLMKKYMVRPSSSSSTPNEHKTYKISLFDQLLSPPIYVGSIFFYEGRGFSTDSMNEISHKIRESLSNILTSFYPLSGKFDPYQNSIIDCYENGVQVKETRVNARLLDVIRDPNVEQVIKEYLPLDPVRFWSESLLFVQINFFDCGGFAIGICFSHKIGDGMSLFAFMNAWAAACRGDDQWPTNNYLGLLSRRFPSVDCSYNFPESIVRLEKDQVLETKRFVFDKEKLRALRDSNNNNKDVTNPTRVELVSSFLWKHFKTSTAEKGKKRAHAAVHTVNLRPRTSLVQDETRNIFGNYFMCAVANGGDVSEHQTMDELLFKLGKAIRSIDVDAYVRKAEIGDMNYVVRDLGLLAREDTDVFAFSSWCRFPAYEVDFGWGNPFWVTPANVPLKHCTFLMDTRNGDGIEAWVSVLDNEELEDLQTHFKLLGEPLRLIED